VFIKEQRFPPTGDFMDNSIFLENARKKIKEGWSVDDVIRKLIMLSDSIEKAENILFEQVYDVYFLYYPEAASVLKERDKFIDLIEKAVDRHSLIQSLQISEDSMGYDLDGEDLQLLSFSVNELKNISDLKKLVDERLYNLVSENYPNFSAILGQEIAAKMIYLGKKGRSLALMTSSKLQVLGAEKAMFASRKKKTTPKYGVIYNHDALVKVNDNLKGKAAKIVASCALLAIKTDVFSKEDKRKEISEKMNKNLSKLVGNNGNKKSY
jgi:nucleolar protein 58